MKANENIRWGTVLENSPLSMVRKAVFNLRNQDDIKGAVLIYNLDSIIAYEMPNNLKFKEQIPKILKKLENGFENKENDPPKILFEHQIIDYNGYKILVKRLIPNLTLLVMLQKHGYLSLAMIDVENSIRWIKEIISIYEPLDSLT
jgi:hypothetical protein